MGDLGPPPWAEVSDHKCLKYAIRRAVERHCTPWVRWAVDQMIATLPPTEANVLIDVRWWRWLEIGDIPGVPGWHYDCRNTSELGEDEHRLYFYGAGCRTMFRPDYQPPEGAIFAYNHRDQHQITPATVAGPRLLIRCSTTDLPPTNAVYETAYVVRGVK